MVEKKNGVYHSWKFRAKRKDVDFVRKVELAYLAVHGITLGLESCMNFSRNDTNIS